MEGEQKRAGITGRKKKKEDVKPGPNQEYDFFVIREEGGTVETAPPDDSVKVKKKGGRNKNTSFFLSD